MRRVLIPTLWVAVGLLLGSTFSATWNTVDREQIWCDGNRVGYVQGLLRAAPFDLRVPTLEEWDNMGVACLEADRWDAPWWEQPIIVNKTNGVEPVSE